MNRCLTLLATAMFVLPASAHEGEDHGAPAAATAPVVDVGPRAAAATELFELVAVVSGDHLTLYLDRFASNEPVSGAKVDVELGELKTSAVELEAGVYQMIAADLAQSGPHALLVAVEAGDDVDLLSLTIEGPEQPASASPAAPALVASALQGWRHPLVWGTSGAVLLAGAGVVVLRRKSAGTNSDEEVTK
jgi:hypothetical protein